MQAADGVHTIDDFRWICSWLAAGSQPEEDGFRELDAAGVRYVVNLRTRDETADVLRVTRRAKPVHIPVENDEPPTEEQALRWLDLCAAHAPAEKFFIHCQAGHGRTSTFAILVRIAQGVDVEQAFEEEMVYGFDPAGKHKAQAAFLREFARSAGTQERDVPRLPAE